MNREARVVSNKKLSKRDSKPLDIVVHRNFLQTNTRVRKGLYIEGPSSRARPIIALFPCIRNLSSRSSSSSQMQKMIGVTYSWGDCAMDYHSLQVLILHKNVQASCRVNNLPLRKHTRHGKTFSTHSSYNFCTHLQSMMPLFRSVELIYENLSLQRYAKAAGTVVMRTSSKHDTVLRFIDFDWFRFVTVHCRKRVESDLTISS